MPHHVTKELNLVDAEHSFCWVEVELVGALHLKDLL